MLAVRFDDELYYTKIEKKFQYTWMCLNSFKIKHAGKNDKIQINMWTGSKIKNLLTVLRRQGTSGGVMVSKLD